MSWSYCSIHLAHAAFADLGGDAIRAEGGAWAGPSQVSLPHSTGDRARTGNAQLAGSFGPSQPVLRGYPQRGGCGVKRTNVYRGRQGEFWEVRDHLEGEAESHPLGGFLEPVERPLWIRAHETLRPRAIARLIVSSHGWIRAQLARELDSRGVSLIVDILRGNQLVWRDSLLHPLL